MDAMRPLKICPHPPGICEISKANMLISPLNNLLHATASTGACVELTCLEKTRFEKYLGLIPGEGKICRNHPDRPCAPQRVPGALPGDRAAKALH